MSKKACTPDNAACEGFFGRLKNEMYYNRTWNDTSMQEFIEVVDEYSRWYNQKRASNSRLAVGVRLSTDKVYGLLHNPVQENVRTPFVQFTPAANKVSARVTFCHLSSTAQGPQGTGLRQSRVVFCVLSSTGTIGIVCP
jgi:hypothetical protein